MSARTLSLRVKLIAALAVVVAAASAPLIYVAYEDTYDHALAAARTKFENAADTVSSDLERNYLNTQTLVVEKSAIEKDDVIAELNAVEAWISAGRTDRMRPTLQFLVDTWETYVGVVNDWGEFLVLSGAVREAWRQNVVDYLGVPFRDYLKNIGHNFSRDEFTVLNLKFKNQEAPYLVGVRKVAGYTAVVMQSLDYLVTQKSERAAQMKVHALESLMKPDLDRAAALVVRDAHAAVVAERGRAAQVSESLREQARRDGQASGVVQTDAGDVLASVRYLPAIDWYVEASMPMSVIVEPARAYARTLVSMALGVFALVSLLGLWLVAWFLKPLRNLAKTAVDIRGVDLLAQDAVARLDKLRTGLPPGERDEVGQVSRAFGRMLRALSENIAELKVSLARQHHIEGEMRAAQEIQTDMLEGSGALHVKDGLEACALMDPAREVGGDLYDVQPLSDGRYGLVVGDVSGKGVSAALLMAVTLTLVRNALKDGLTPAAAMKKVNDQIAARNPSCMFVTLWIGVFSPETGRLEYANGGHCAPVVVRPDATLRRLSDVSGPLVGALEMAQFGELCTEVEEGAAVVLYTDGVTEAMNEKRELFGDARLDRALSLAASASPADMAQAVKAAVAQHRGSAEQSDDITLLVFRRPQVKES